MGLLQHELLISIMVLCTLTGNTSSFTQANQSLDIKGDVCPPLEKEFFNTSPSEQLCDLGTREVLGLKG